MLLILTNSLDGTSDEIVRRIGSQKVFRFNVDQWRDYEIYFDCNGFSLSDPTGRQCFSHQIRALYSRKPTFDDAISVPEGGCLEDWLRAQINHFIQELYNWCRDRGLTRLVERGAQRRFGKLNQLLSAKKHFDIPQWAFIRGSQSVSFPSPCVTKPLTADFIGDYKVVFTRSVDPSSLDPEYPWLVQREIMASHDVTVVYIAGRCFAFALDRSSFEGVDWRKHINRQDLRWRTWSMPEKLEANIRAFMQGRELDFGRLDFLFAEKTHYFLELNPNGQWAWLDIDGSHGIFDAVVSELTRGWT